MFFREWKIAGNKKAQAAEPEQDPQPGLYTLFEEGGAADWKAILDHSEPEIRIVHMGCEADRDLGASDAEPREFQGRCHMDSDAKCQ